ncbi:hypothetical protein ACFWCB_06000 [Streptomyces sp. NPDC060048]|uniref:hypothetical protein n=1 Tax=unclassified Streptomyces TaxID=2593676 RepID=UPI0036946ABA
MTSNEAETTAVATDEGIQQIPAVIEVTEVPAAADARDALLRAIGAEAQLVADQFPGQASTALGELARAYALVTAGTTTVPGVGIVSTSGRNANFSGNGSGIAWSDDGLDNLYK